MFRLASYKTRGLPKERNTFHILPSYRNPQKIMEKLMTTTLTWHVKPIVFPRINSNLLALVGLTLICTMAFAMIHPALASHCGPEERALQSALVDLV